MTGHARKMMAVLVFLIPFAASANVETGLAYFKGGKYEEAAAAFQQAADKDPSDDRAWYMLAQCFRQMARTLEAERALGQAIEIRPERPEYRHSLALVLLDTGRPREALAEAGEGIRQADTAQAIYALHVVTAAALGDLGRWREAAGELERARAIRGDSVLLDLLGHAYFQQGDDARAVTAWAEAQAQDPGDGPRLRFVVESFLRIARQSSDPFRKREAYGRALELASRYHRGREDDPEADHLLGRAALGAGRFDDAESAFRRVLTRSPRNCFALANLGKVLLAREELATAERFLLRASACAPRMGAVHEALGALWLMEGRLTRAAQAFGKAMRFDPSPVAAAGLQEAQSKIGVVPEGKPLQVPVADR
jgi:superkiller protein 3